MSYDNYDEYLNDKLKNKSTKEYNLNYDEYLDEKLKKEAMRDYIFKITNIENSNLNPPDPTPLKISTRSATSEISTFVDLVGIITRLMKNIIKNIIKGENPDYLIKGVIMKKFSFSTLEKHKKKTLKLDEVEKALELLSSKKREHFYNSASIYVKPDKERRPISIKLFSNGSISMTGCKENIDGRDAVNVLLAELKKYGDECFADKPQEEIDEYNAKKNSSKVNGVKDPDQIAITKYDITMINSDFKLNFMVDRKKLHNILLYDTNLMALYDDYYPGVKIYYFWNMFNDDNDGVCKCVNKLKCKGKGNGMGEGKCKRITIAVFQSGSVMITGARSELQINHVYKDIIKLIHNNYGKIIKFSILDHIKPLDDEPPDESYITEADNEVGASNFEGPVRRIKIKRNKERYIGV